MRKKDFPFFENNPGLAYLDNAATTQKPLEVINAERDYYLKNNVNIKRGSYALAEKTTAAYEAARGAIAGFLDAEAEELAFFSGTTEAINAVATMLRGRVGRGDRIIVGGTEHHSNFLPWKVLAEERGAKLEVIFPAAADLSFRPADFTAAIDRKTKIVAFAGTSNFTGFKWPEKDVRTIALAARKAGAYSVLDGAQYIQHGQISFKKLGVDFLAFSGHKIYAPMGAGGLLQRKESRDGLTPPKYGGEMVKQVRLGKIVLEDHPHILEAGTPNVGGAIALHKAIAYLQKIGVKKIAATETDLTEHLLKRLREIEGIEIYGPRSADKRAPLVAFNLKGLHAHDVGYFLNKNKIAVRVGEHCAGPAHEKLGIPASVRASLAFYNTKEEIDRLAEALHLLAEKR